MGSEEEQAQEPETAQISEEQQAQDSASEQISEEEQAKVLDENSREFKNEDQARAPVSLESLDEETAQVPVNLDFLDDELSDISAGEVDPSGFFADVERTASRETNDFLWESTSDQDAIHIKMRNMYKESVKRFF